MIILVLLFILFRIFVFFLGVLIVFFTIISALRNFVLPRSAPDPISRAVFLTMRRIFDLRSKRARSYEVVDRIMELYTPVSLVALLLTWLTLIQLGYMGMFWALGVQSWYDSFKISGSSLFTLGFALSDNLPTTILTFSEAIIGLILIALLISYLPTMYAAFSRREAAVTMLEVRAGSPPSAVELIKRFHRLGRFDHLHDLWEQWEAWFVDLEESHTSLAALSFYRSPQPHRSWVTAAGAVLDSASLILAVVDIPHDAQADLAIRAGYLSLRYIAAFFRIPSNPYPTPSDPISVTREEFDQAYADLASAGVPLKPDKDRAWRDFAGWRVNYDTVLLALARLTLAPSAPWSSDRAFKQQKTLPAFKQL